MTNEQKAKLDILVNFLTENQIQFYTTFKGKTPVKADVYVPKFRIMVKISEGKEKDDIFYDMVKYHFHPLFIREIETKEFVLEKIQNLIIDLMKKQHIKYNK